MDKILELEKKRKARIEAVKAEKEALKPTLFDTNNIPAIYDLFEKTSKELKTFPEQSTNRYRERFVYIIIDLYSPGVFLGDKLRVGLRDVIAKVLKVKRRETISDNCAIVRFNYEHYSDFRFDVNYIYAEIITYVTVHKFK